jgi:hypothetical protein
MPVAVPRICSRTKTQPGILSDSHGMAATALTRSTILHPLLVFVAFLIPQLGRMASAELHAQHGVVE